MRLESIIYTAAFLLSIISALAAHGTTSADVPTGKPSAVIDLTTSAGVELVKGQWLYSDVEITEVEFKGPGADGQPTGEAVKTYDYTPKAGGADYDDSKWDKIAPGTLNKRRSTGRICFNWYRIRVTIPESVDGYATAGSTVVFETAIDDYAEVWVNGELARHLGQEGGSVVAGWNAPNRLVIGRGVKTGDTIQIAVFGMNGPISNPPTNFIWMRDAKLEFYPGTESPVALKPSEVNVEVIRLDPAMDAIAGPNPKIFKLAEGFKFTEGPVWVKDGEYLLFSDPNSNIIYKYSKDGELTEFRKPSGYSGSDIGEYTQPGSNGLALDNEGRLTVDEHGNHRVSRIEKDGTVTVLAESFEGKRLNSPNDLVYKSDGSVYFTDPPFGLPMFENDPRKEIPWSGVYRISPDGEITLLNKDLKGPNGIAFSPDEKYLYVGNWDPENKVVMRYEAMEDGTLSDGERFFDMTGAPGEDAIDGIKVDSNGNLYVSGPGGLWVISSEGKHLGTIIAPQHIHNVAWGGEDGKTLFLCAQSGLYMMRLGIQGAKAHYN
ncbi:MAG: SMP-30/gluconolactonase/LRE family protein [Thermodesulfobacteriota bacterium]